LSSYPTDTVRVACVQMAPPARGTKKDRVEHAISLIDQLPPVNLIVLPELWPVGFFRFDRYKEESESLEESLKSGSVAAVREVAVRRKAFVLGGSFVERAGRGRFHNTSFLLGPDGELLMTYRKMHVFGYRSKEADLLTAGDSVAVADTPVGMISATTCYDLRFPELYRALVDAGAQIVLVPSAWPMERLDHWAVLNQTRALENQMYVVACNMAGEEEGTTLAGNSMIVDPWGEVIARAGEGEQVLLAELDMNRLLHLREEFPVLKDRRLGTQGGRLSEPTLSTFAESGS
jgi:predicted amidohydrolase